MGYTQSHKGRDLTRDVVFAHEHLGLALNAETLQQRCGEGVFACWASLTPRVGGGELCALEAVGLLDVPQAQPRLARLAKAVALMQRTLQRCGAESISTVAFQVPSGGDGRKAWLVRCTNRGQAAPSIVDAGSAEMGGLVGAWLDPYALIDALRADLV